MNFTPYLVGAYELELVVNDGKEDSAPSRVIVTAVSANAAPTANAGPDRSNFIGITTTLDAQSVRIVAASLLENSNNDMGCGCTGSHFHGSLAPGSSA